MSKANREKRTRPHPVPSLEEAMAQVLAMTEAGEQGTENRTPFLYMWKTDGSLTICALAIQGSGPQFACGARLMTFKEEPAVAVVSVESWHLDLDPTVPLEQQDPMVRAWLERRQRGEEAPLTALPRDYIGEDLLLMGEDQDGQMADWIYKIHPALGEGKRRFERVAGLATEHNVFHPLFILPWARREGIPEDLARTALREEAVRAGLWPT